MEALVSDCPEVDLENNSYNADEEFELWRIIKQKAFSKLLRIHNTVRYGEFIATKLKRAAGKVPVFGILKHGGKVYTKIIPDTKSTTFMPIKPF